jgi:PTH2 family peptidyl-tRNA hydrolase
MDACMYILVPRDLNMSKGKMAAQVAHAAVEGYRLSRPDMIAAWYVGGHYTKIVLACDDVLVTERYLDQRGIPCRAIIDEGLTEFDGALTPTAIGCAILNRDDEHVEATFSSFKLYRDDPPPYDESQPPKRRRFRFW